MGNYLNPGNDMFYKMVHSEIYVDKTGLIGYQCHLVSIAYLKWLDFQ